jgi:hypothetical protein
MSDKQFHFVVVATVRDGRVDKCNLEIDPHCEDYFLEGTVFDEESGEWQDCYSDENIETDEEIGLLLMNLLKQHNESRSKK